MSDIDQHFEIDGFRFVLSLRSTSLEVNSVINDNKEEIRKLMWRLSKDDELNNELNSMVKAWKESHK